MDIDVSMINAIILIAYMSTGNFIVQELECYRNAMIGYDSVINSRVGVPAEHAIDLTNDITIRNVIWHAYLWKASPHEYAIKTFSACVQTIDKYGLNKRNRKWKTLLSSVKQPMVQYLGQATGARDWQEAVPVLETVNDYNTINSSNQPLLLAKMYQDYVLTNSYNLKNRTCTSTY